jgi:Na+/pantothenate symporter
VLNFGGGLGDISRTILAHDPTFLGPWGRLTPLAALSFFFVFSMGSLGQPQAVHKYYMLRDPLQLKWYPLLKTLGLVLVLLLYFSVGVGVKAFVLSGRLAPLASPDQATPALLLNVTPILLAALVFSGACSGHDERG